MPHFVRIVAPVASPTQCWSCHTHKNTDGFADRGLVIQHYGHVYTCAQCARDMGRLFGMVDGEQLARALDVCREQSERINALEAELEAERAPEAKVVSLTEAIKLHEKAKRRTPRAKTPA